MKKTSIITILFSFIIAGAFVYSWANDAEGALIENNSFSDKPVEVPFDSIFIDLDRGLLKDKQHKLDSIFDRMRRLTGLNGTVLYAEKGRVVFKKAYGFKNLRRKIPIQLKDTFQLASVSKMFAATAIMILQEEGKLNYEDDLKSFFPNFPYENVYISHLLNHRSGLPRYMSIAHEHWQDKTIPMDNDQMLDLFNQYQPRAYFKPGNGFHYCNTNYALLANVVEMVAGVPFDIFVRDKIFKPAGMNNSFVFQMREDSCVSSYIPNGLPGFNMRYRRPRKVRNDYLNGVMGDKNIYSTVEDLFKFDQALKSGVLLSQATQKVAYTPGYAKARKKNLYGYGWRIKPERDSTVYHFGWWKGFRTFFIRDLAQDKTIIMLTNTDKGMGSTLLWNILDDQSADLAPVCKIPEEEVDGDHYTNMYEEQFKEHEEELLSSTSS